MSKRRSTPKQKAASRKNLEKARAARAKQGNFNVTSGNVTATKANKKAATKPGANRDSKWDKLAEMRKAYQADRVYAKAHPGVPLTRMMYRPRYTKTGLGHYELRQRGAVGDGIRGRRKPLQK